MKDWQLGVVTVSLTIGILSVIWGLMWMTMAKDLGEKVGFLEQDIIEYRWQLEEAYYICQERE